MVKLFHYVDNLGRIQLCFELGYDDYVFVVCRISGSFRERLDPHGVFRVLHDDSFAQAVS